MTHVAVSKSEFRLACAQRASRYCHRFLNFHSKTEIIDIAKKASVSDWFGSKRQGLHRARGQSGLSSVFHSFFTYVTPQLLVQLTDISLFLAVLTILASHVAMSRL